MSFNVDSYLENRPCTLECDNCKKEFLLKSVTIYEAEVDCRGQKLTLMFFVCPHCNTIYRVSLKDAQFEQLQSDLNRAKAKMRKLHGSGKIQAAEKQSNAILRKQERLKRYTQNLNSKYSGTFTFAASKNNEKGVIIIYRE